jgi:predicted MPP superfamily phosphohydrolase
LPGIFPQYDYDLYASGVTNMIINACLGESGLPIRINIQPKIVLITLEAAQVAQ